MNDTEVQPSDYATHDVLPAIVGAVGGALGGLFKKKKKKKPAPKPEPPKPKVPVWAWVAGGVGVVALLGTVIFAVKR